MRTSKKIIQMDELKGSFMWQENKNHPAVIVSMYLNKNEDGQIVLSCVGQIFGEAVDQCKEDIDKYLKGDVLWDRIYYLWDKYHMNDMHAGTPRQENLIKMGKLVGVDLSNYTKQLDFLREYHMEYDELDGEQYYYGSRWIYRPIPEDDLWDIFVLITQR